VQTGTVKVWNASSIIKGDLFRQAATGNPKLRFALATQAKFRPTSPSRRDGQGLTTWEGADQVQVRSVAEPAPKAAQGHAIRNSSPTRPTESSCCAALRTRSRSRAMTGQAAPRSSGWRASMFAVSPDGTLIACAGEQGVKAPPLPRISLAEPALAEAYLGVGPLSCSARTASCWSCAARGDTLQAWDVALEEDKVDRRGTRARCAGSGPVGIIGIGPSAGDGKRVISASRDHTLRFWDAGSGEEQLKVSLSFSPMDLALAPGEPLLALRGSSGNLWLYDSDTGALLGNPLPRQRPQVQERRRPAEHAGVSRRTGACW